MYVMFCNDYGDGDLSDPVKFKIKSLEPSEPILEIKESSHNSVTLCWQTEVNAGSVDRYLVLDNLKEKLLACTRMDEFYLEVKNLKSSTTYSFVVAAVYWKRMDSSVSIKE